MCLIFGPPLWWQRWDPTRNCAVLVWICSSYYIVELIRLQTFMCICCTVFCVSCNFSFFTILVCPLLVQVAVLPRSEGAYTCGQGERVKQISRDKPENVYEPDYRPSHKAKSTRRTPCKTRYRAEDQEGYGSDSAVSDLRSGTGGRDR